MRASLPSPTVGVAHWPTPSGVELGWLDKCLLETVVDGVVRKTWVMLLTGETFLLGSRHDVTIADDGRGGIVIKGRNAKDDFTHRAVSPGRVAGMRPERHVPP